MKWRKTCTGLTFDLEHFNGPQTKFICDSLYKHPVHKVGDYIHLTTTSTGHYSKVTKLRKLTILFWLYPVPATIYRYIIII